MSTLFETLQTKMNRKLGIPACCCLNDAVLKELSHPHPDNAKIKEMVMSKRIPRLIHADTGNDAIICNATVADLAEDEVLIDLDEGKIIFGSGEESETVSDKLDKALRTPHADSAAPDAQNGASDDMREKTPNAQAEADRIMETVKATGAFPIEGDTNTHWSESEDGVQYRAKLRSGFDRAFRENILQIQNPSPEFLAGIGCTEDEFELIQEAASALMNKTWPKEVWDRAFPNGISSFEIEKALNPKEYSSRGVAELPGKEGRQTVIGKNRFE